MVVPSTSYESSSSKLRPYLLAFLCVHPIISLNRIWAEGTLQRTPLGKYFRGSSYVANTHTSGSARRDENIHTTTSLEQACATKRSHTRQMEIETIPPKKKKKDRPWIAPGLSSCCCLLSGPLRGGGPTLVVLSHYCSRGSC